MLGDWLTNDLKEEARQVFENAYKKRFSSEEVLEMCHNLVVFFEVIKDENENRQFRVQAKT